jgi:hypothetical protein
MGNIEFSKLILLFETFLVAVVSGFVLWFCYLSITLDYNGSLGYLTAMIGAVWTAYGGSISVYQNKSGKENVKKIEFASVVNNDQDSD